MKQRKTARRTGRRRLGAELVEAMRDAAEHVEGRRAGLRTHVVPVRVARIDVRVVRRKTGLSQDRFAATFGFSAANVRQWEQRRRTPSGAARVLLRVIDRDPEAVLRALAR
jgi:putative transcriptional regulator